MASIQFKQLDLQADIKPQTFPSLNSLLASVTSESLATASNIAIYSIGPFTGSFIYKPDVFGSTTAGISPSGAINSATKKFFNRYDPKYYNAASGVYTLPASHTANTNVVCGRVIEVAQPTKSSGIWPNSFTAVLRYNSASITAVDNSANSFGTNQESLVFGKITDITNPAHVLGSIFYDDAMVILHGGTGVATAFTNASITGMAFSGSITGALTSSTSATHIIVDSLQFRTYQMLTRNIYFCYLKPDEFNYTSNPSAQNVDFLQRQENATTYITTIGLFDDRQNLLAVGKVAPAVRKNAFISHIFRVVLSI